jgi:transcriptional antiterminator NusG
MTEQATQEVANEQPEVASEASAEVVAEAPAEAEAIETADIAQVMDAPAKEETADKNAPVTRNRGMRWYIIHAYTGFERKVAAAILDEAEKKGLSELFEEVTVPSEDVLEMRRGKKVKTERNMFPGYVMAKMQMTDATWQLVRTTDKVAGFLGGRGQRPQPITEAEANTIIAQVQEGVEAPKRAINYEIGEQVKVIDGPFDGFIGTVEDYDEDKEKLKVSVSIFGRPTPVEPGFDQVDKV